MLQLDFACHRNDYKIVLNMEFKTPSKDNQF
ncbi:MAG: hypothetical protein K0R51_3054 [Cytophagaceae bacterium]|jgi:hypothetical protein|nr:hypothetical protein [Cytophagaceae bacterium]